MLITIKFFHYIILLLKDFSKAIQLQDLNITSFDHLTIYCGGFDMDSGNMSRQSVSNTNNTYVIPEPMSVSVQNSCTCLLNYSFLKRHPEEGTNTHSACIVQSHLWSIPWSMTGKSANKSIRWSAARHLLSNHSAISWWICTTEEWRLSCNLSVLKWLT